MKSIKAVLFFIIAVLYINTQAQTFTDSNLPIVVIETDGGANIPDEPKVLGTMKIIWHQDGSRNYMSNIDNPEFLNYDGRMGIDGEEFEFIEITNNGDNEVDLTGVYFRELGITYRFPNGSNIAPHEALMLCSDSLAFIDRYQMVPFGQYTRKLSNKSENLVLADAWGNIIDEVHYYDSEPWPTEPDGNGPYLELKNLDSDNSLAENWTFCDDLTHVLDLSSAYSIEVYPNPAKDRIRIHTNETVISCQIVDLLGRVVAKSSPMQPDFELNLDNLTQGMYLLKTQTLDGRMLLSKFVKQ